MNDFSGIPIKEFWGYRMGDEYKEDVISQSLQRMVLPALFWFSNWQGARYRITQEKALNAFRAAVRIGASAENEQEVKTLWLNFFQEFGIPFGIDDNGDTITMETSQLIAMPVNAYAAYTIAHALKRGDVKTIKRLAHYHEYIEDTGRFRWHVTFADYQPYHALDQTMQVYDLIYQRGIDTSMRNAKNESWRIAAREWLEKTVSHYTGSMIVTIEKGHLTLQHEGLLSAMWFAFWNSTQLYPRPIIKFCRKCGQPIETDSTRRQLCDDCKREKERVKRANNRASVKARKQLRDRSSDSAV